MDEKVSVSELARQPVGGLVGGGQAKPPGPVVFEGAYCRVEALDAARHRDGLWQSFEDDETLWTYMGSGPFAGPADFVIWLEGRAALSDPFSYAVVEAASGMAAGIVTLMEIRPAMGVIEMGSIVYGPTLQRTRAATEAQYLMARYVFDELDYRRYEWKCNALNAPSRRAALRLGFTFEGVFRQHMIVKGRNRDTAWYAMLDRQWPERKAAFERWLAPENFDRDGKQIVSLSSLNTTGRAPAEQRL